MRILHSEIIRVLGAVVVGELIAWALGYVGVDHSNRLSQRRIRFSGFIIQVVGRGMSSIINLGLVLFKISVVEVTEVKSS